MTNLLSEDYSQGVKENSKTRTQAKQLGLIYLGFGRYGNKNHEVTHIVKDNHLVKVIKQPNPKAVRNIRDIHKHVDMDLQNHITKYGEDIDKEAKEHPEKFKDTTAKTQKETREYLKSVVNQYKQMMDDYENELNKAQQEQAYAKANGQEVVSSDEYNEYNLKIEDDLNTSDQEQLKMSAKFQKHYDSFLNKYSTNEWYSIKQYTGEDSGKMTKFAVRMASDPELQEKFKKTNDEFYSSDSIKQTISEMKALDSAMDRIPIPEDCFVYSGLRGPFADAKAYKKGDVVQFHGYLSTSFSRQTATRFTTDESDKKRHMSDEATELGHSKFIVQINCKKGQSGIYVGNNSAITDELELILPRGCKFKVMEEPHIIKGHGAGIPDAVVVHLERIS